MNNRENVAVVFPINEIDINDIGIIALKQAAKVLCNYNQYYVIPYTLGDEYIEVLKEYSGTIIKVDDKYFGSTEAHNNFLQSRDFYNYFVKYDYILLHHMDAFVFRDEIEEFIELGVDYIGAPWDKGEYYNGKRYYVGNGGFSLRKVKSFLKYIDELRALHEETGLNEDFCVAILGDTLMDVADIESARRFSFELNVKLNYIENNEKLPMGCHAWDKTHPYFWKPYIESHGYNVPDSIFNFGAMKFLDYKCTGVKDYEIFDRQIRDFLCGETLFLWGCGYYGRLIFAAFDNIGVRITGVIDSIKEGYMANLCILKPNEVDYNNKPKIFIAINQDVEQVEHYLNEQGYVHGMDYLLLRDVV